MSVGIARTVHQVYAFVSDPENLPQWATAFCLSVRRSGDEWIVGTPQGPVRVAFVAENDFGVLDHVVTLASGIAILSPMRVVANGAGSEVVFTLFQPPGMSDAEFAADAAMVERDLGTLKAVLEVPGASG